MRLAIRNFGVDIKKSGVSFGRLPASGGMQAASTSGTGFEVTKPSRTRRVAHYIAGIQAAADLHLSKQTLGQLREICRGHDRQGALISGILDRAQDNIVGSNFEFNPRTGDEDLNKKIKEYITERMLKENCDASGVRDFTEMMKTTIRAAWTDGDNLWAKRPDGTTLVFEADQVETPSDRPSNVVLGVELDEVNRQIGFHVKQRGKASNGGYARVATETTRIDAANAFMPAFRKRFGQTRGQPVLAAALGNYIRFNNYFDFESLAAEANSTQGFKITKKSHDNQPSSIVNNPNSATSNTFKKVQKLEPLGIVELLEGEDVSMINSDRPGNNFDPFVVMCCRIIGVAIGYPLELIMLDFSRTNYSSARASMGEARRSFRGWQKWLQTNVAIPWYKWQIARGIATGAIPANKKAFKVVCQWPGWQYIDPKKSAEANAIERAGKVKSRSECIRERGENPAEVFAEIAAENQILKDLGIAETPTTMKVVAGGNNKEDDTDADETNKNNDENAGDK